MKINEIRNKIKNKLRSFFYLIYGCLTFIYFFPRNLLWRSTGGTDSARYCYAVWMRHLVMNAQHGMKAPPHTVAELGPGDSIGIGLAALLTGSNRYLALDIVEYANLQKSIVLVDQLADLIKNRAPIPDENEFPEIKPRLKSYKFPFELFEEKSLSMATAPERLLMIKNYLSGVKSNSNLIQYIVPWNSIETIKHESVDFIFSQAVMEHVDDVQGTYKAAYAWLKRGGFSSHQIDFKSHGLTPTWDGHRGMSAFKWKMLRGKRPYLINRLPCSEHVRFFRAGGFEILENQKFVKPPETNVAKLAREFRDLSAEDRETAGAFLIGRKPL